MVEPLPEMSGAAVAIALCAGMCEKSFHELCADVTPGWKPSAALPTCVDACTTQLAKSPMDAFMSLGLGATLFRTLSAGANVTMCRQFVDEPVTAPEPQKVPKPKTDPYMNLTWAEASLILAQMGEGAKKALPYAETALSLVAAYYLYIQTLGTAGFMINLSTPTETTPTSL